MIHEDDRYHGAVLRELVVRAAGAISIGAPQSHGRVASYILNDRVGLLIKYSSKRLPPWRFTFTDNAMTELAALLQADCDVWTVLVCGSDGMLALTRDELSLLTQDGLLSAPFVHVDRNKRSMYRVSGNAGILRTFKPRGLQPLLSVL